MTLPDIRQIIRDGALGLLALGSNLHLKVGLCTSGPENVVQVFGDPEQMRQTCGGGALIESAASFIEHTGLPVAICRAARTAAGTVGEITSDGDGPAITADGSEPIDAYELRVEILVGGSEEAATFRYSLDGGDTWSHEIAVGDLYEMAEYEIPDSGILLQFSAGTYVAGEVYSATCTPPSFDTSSLSAALDAAIEASDQFRLIHVVGYANGAANSAVIASAVGAKMTAAEAAYRYLYTILESADDTDQNLKTAFASFAHPRVMMAAGFIEYVSAISGRIYKRPGAWPLVERIMSVAVSRDPGAVADGPLNSAVVTLYRDERKTPGLDAARFATLRTFRGLPGFYVTRGRMMASPGSDYSDCTRRQVMDVASRVAYERLLRFVNIDLLLDPATGRLLETEARGIDAYVVAGLREALLSPNPPDASDVQFVVSRTDNILSTETLRAKTRVLPKGYARYIENEIAFRNPANTPTET